MCADPTPLDHRPVAESLPLPADSHVHSEWSWDATAGSMAATCARALALGVPAVAFTEHVDLTRWVMPAATRARLTTHADLVGDDGRFHPPALDVDGYLASIERCREQFPQLRIVSGLELGEPHWFPDQAQQLTGTGAFERVLGSQHSIVVEDEPWLLDQLTGPEAPPGREPRDLVTAYLAETLRLVESSMDFSVLAHIDYPARRWPASGGAFPADFEDELREVLSALARSGRALEVNTRVPLHPLIVSWWREAGGQAVSFGSDAHEPAALAAGFTAAAHMVEAHGFRPDGDVWVR